MRTPTFLRRILGGPSPAVPHRRRLLAERSAEASHPNAGPEPTAHAPDRFELLRCAKDLVVGLGEDGIYGRFCQFDWRTGWPVYSMKEDGGPVPDGIYKIDETTRHLGAPAPCDVRARQAALRRGGLDEC